MLTEEEIKEAREITAKMAALAAKVADRAENGAESVMLVGALMAFIQADLAEELKKY